MCRRVTPASGCGQKLAVTLRRHHLGNLSMPFGKHNRTAPQEDMKDDTVGCSRTSDRTMQVPCTCPHSGGHGEGTTPDLRFVEDSQSGALKSTPPRAQERAFDPNVNLVWSWPAAVCNIKCGVGVGFPQAVEFVCTCRCLRDQLRKPRIGVICVKVSTIDSTAREKLTWPEHQCLAIAEVLRRSGSRWTRRRRRSCTLIGWLVCARQPKCRAVHYLKSRV
jgi:hypothetical protein